MRSCLGIICISVLLNACTSDPSSVRRIVLCAHTMGDVEIPPLAVRVNTENYLYENWKKQGTKEYCLAIVTSSAMVTKITIPMVRRQDLEYIELVRTINGRTDRVPTQIQEGTAQFLLVPASMQTIIVE